MGRIGPIRVALALKSTCSGTLATLILYPIYGARYASLNHGIVVVAVADYGKVNCCRLGLQLIDKILSVCKGFVAVITGMEYE